MPDIKRGDERTFILLYFAELHEELVRRRFTARHTPLKLNEGIASLHRERDARIKEFDGRAFPVTVEK